MAESRAKDTRDSTRHPCLNGYSVSRADSRECASSRYATLGNAGQVLAALVGEGQRKRERGWNGGMWYVVRIYAQR